MCTTFLSNTQVLRKHFLNFVKTFAYVNEFLLELTAKTNLTSLALQIKLGYVGFPLHICISAYSVIH